MEKTELPKVKKLTFKNISKHPLIKHCPLVVKFQ